VKKNCFKLKKKELQNNNVNRGSNDNSSRDQQFLNTGMAFVTTSKNETLTHEIWIYDSGAWGHYCSFKEGLMNVKEI
jgi:hypothetical protein